MNKLLIVVLLAAAGALGWLLLSKPEVAAPAGTAASKAVGQTAGQPAGPAKTQVAEASSDSPAAPATQARVVMPPPPAGAPVSALVLGAPVRAPGEPAPIVGDPMKQSPWGRDPAKGMVDAPTADVKTTVRRYWGNLPKSGAVPPRITVDELLPPSVIAALNVPPQSLVTMLGDFRIGDPQSFKSVLEKPDDVQTMVGITVVTPDGKEIRDYVRMFPPAK